MSISFQRDLNHITEYIQHVSKKHSGTIFSNNLSVKEDFGDLCLTGIGKESLKISSFILASFSTMLRNLLKSSPGCNQVILPDFNVDCILSMLGLAYTGK